MRAAVINDNGEIINFIAADAAVDTLPGVRLVNVGDDVTFRHVWNGSAFVPNAEWQAEIEAADAAFQALVWEDVG